MKKTFSIAQKGQRKIDLELQVMRHTMAHVMAAAIYEIWPDAKFGVGPDIENGFYYDLDMQHRLVPEDLLKIEAKMKEIRKRKTPLERQEISIDEAIKLMEEQNQPYKVELLKLLQEKGSTKVLLETGDKNLVDDNNEGLDTVTLYRLGTFVDLCRGPHLDHTGQMGHFKLNSLAGAYWRGNENNPQLQRIYGLGFRNKQDLSAEIDRLEQLKLRDHRRLGKELRIFTFDEEVGKGLPLWLPGGTVLRDEFQRFATEQENREGYQRITTPILARGDLYHTSGHLPYYAEDMYPPMNIEGDEFYLRPMNCPHHHKTFASSKHSYRDLPIRFAEYGEVYRYESSGSLSGLMRTRGFCQNDAHIYCRPDQAEQEFIDVMELHARYYASFGIEDFHMRLSLPDLENLNKYVDAPEKWKEAVEIVRNAMDKSGLPYVEVEGEAAFYGPKIDFMIRSVVGTEYAISTSQLDFLATETFDLNYIGEDGEKHPLYVIHRAPLGSHERFTAFLLEHYAGKFPTWLAPTQARIIPISEKHNEYCAEVASKLIAPRVHNAHGSLRADVDHSTERMQKKIRNAQLEKIPYILVAGDQEKENGTVSVRLRSGEVLGALPVEEVVSHIVKETEARKDFVYGTDTPKDINEFTISPGSNSAPKSYKS